MVGLSAALALSLPLIIRFAAKKLLIVWSLIGSDKVFFISIEMMLTILLILLCSTIRKGWKDRKFSNMARTAGIVLVTPGRGFFAKRRIRKLKERHGLARDVMVISSTGFRTFVDPKGELRQVIENCREAKIMLLNPSSEGAIVRAKGIPYPDVTPESFGEQIRKSIDFLKLLKGAQRNVRLKLYPDPPFLKMTILGDFIWLQYYQPGLDGQRMPRYVFKHDPDIGSLYFPFYQYFLGRWNNPEIPEYDLETDELIYRDGAGNEVKREKFYEMEPHGQSPWYLGQRPRGATFRSYDGAFLNGQRPCLHTGVPAFDETLRAARCFGTQAWSPAAGMKTNAATNRDLTDHLIPQNENKGGNRTSPPLWAHRDFVRAGDSCGALRQNLCSGLHPGSKEFFLLRSKSPMGESAGWNAI
jgi:hypothetical protein